MNAAAAVGHILRTLPAAALATFLALFPIVNPFGGIPLFFALTASFTPEERNREAMKTAAYVFAILAVFMLFGRFVLSFFGISLPVLKIAGGLIVANTAWGMVTGSSRITSAARRGNHQGRFLANPDGDAHAFRTGLHRRRHGSSGPRR